MKHQVRFICSDRQSVQFRLISLERILLLLQFLVRLPAQVLRRGVHRGMCGIAKKTKSQSLEKNLCVALSKFAIRAKIMSCLSYLQNCHKTPQRKKRAKRTPGITVAALFQNLLQVPGSRRSLHSGKTLPDLETNTLRSTPANQAVNSKKKWKLRHGL